MAEESGEWGETAEGYEVLFFWHNKSVLKLDSGDDCTTGNILKMTGLYTLKGWIIEYVNYISVRKKQCKQKESNTKYPSLQNGDYRCA